MAHEKRDFFHKINVTVLSFVIAYSLTYGILGAYSTAFFLIVSAVVWTPLVLWFDKFGYNRLARFMFLGGCIFYVYVTPLTIRYELEVDYYFLPGMMLSILLFDAKQKKEIVASLIFPLLGWTLVTLEIYPPFPASWLVKSFPSEPFRAINFLGAFLITGIFIHLYVKGLMRLKMDAFQSLSRAHNSLIISNENLNFKEREMRALLDGLHVGVIKLNGEGTVVHFNKSAQTILEFSGLESSASLTAVLEKGVETLSTGQDCENSIFQFKNLEGEPRWLSLTTTSYFVDERQNKREVIVTFSDITESHIRDSELRQTLAAINQSAIVTITDKNGSIISVSDNLCRVSGYTQDELLGQNHRIFKSGIHPYAHYSKMWSAISSGLVWVGELTNKNKIGQFFTVKTVISPILGIDGKIERYISISFDISHEKDVEQRLDEAQDVAKLGSWYCDYPDGFHHWSRQMKKLFQIPPGSEAMSHTQFLKAFTPEDSKFIGEAFEKCGKFGVPWKRRAQVLIENKKLWVEVVGHAKINPDGQIIGVYGTCQDIEGLVEAEEMTKLERTKAMHAAKLASLGEMSAGIAHEINNPLAIISANASLLMERELPREKVLEKLDRLVKASSRIGKIVGGLRKFARISDGKVHQVTSVKALFSELNFLTEVKSKRTNVPVTVNVETDAKIDCDEIEIQQVLINLINNAIDAAKGLSDKWVDVKGFEDKNEVVIQVWDSGPGIQPAIAAKIFEPFFTTKPVGEGTGLGLSITKGILDEHKAKIDVLQGVPNTCFEIRFIKAGENNEAAA